MRISVTNRVRHRQPSGRDTHRRMIPVKRWCPKRVSGGACHAATTYHIARPVIAGAAKRIETGRSSVMKRFGGEMASSKPAGLSPTSGAERVAVEEK
jgi:hypothetical protein